MHNDSIPTIGEVIATEFLEPLKISQNSLAKALGIPQNRISDIINGKRGISADTDLRLCRYFGLTDGFFSGNRRRVCLSYRMAFKAKVRRKGGRRFRSGKI